MPENGPGLPVPAEGQGHGRPQKRGDGDLDNRAGQGHRLYGQQILEVKVQTDSEHEQNVPISAYCEAVEARHKAGGVRAHRQPQQIAHRGERRSFCVMKPRTRAALSPPAKE